MKSLFLFTTIISMAIPYVALASLGGESSAGGGGPGNPRLQPSISQPGKFVLSVINEGHSDGIAREILGYFQACGLKPSENGGIVRYTMPEFGNDIALYEMPKTIPGNDRASLLHLNAHIAYSDITEVYGVGNGMAIGVRGKLAELLYRCMPMAGLEPSGVWTRDPADPSGRMDPEYRGKYVQSCRKQYSGLPSLIGTSCVLANVP